MKRRRWLTNKKVIQQTLLRCLSDRCIFLLFFCPSQTADAVPSECSGESGGATEWDLVSLDKRNETVVSGATTSDATQGALSLFQRCLHQWRRLSTSAPPMCFSSLSNVHDWRYTQNGKLGFLKRSALAMLGTSNRPNLLVISEADNASMIMRWYFANKICSLAMM